MNRFLSLTPALLLLFAGTAAALDSDQNQPIELSAGQADMSNVTGVGVYTEDVVLVQGTMRITGDKMTVYTSPAGELVKAVVEGKPATYRQLPEGEQEYVHAEAPRMEYTAEPPRLITLMDGAVLTRGKNRFQGETIRYRVDEDQVLAQGGKDRVNITFYPNQKSGADSE